MAFEIPEGASGDGALLSRLPGDGACSVNGAEAEVLPNQMERGNTGTLLAPLSSLSWITPAPSASLFLPAGDFDRKPSQRSSSHESSTASICLRAAVTSGVSTSGSGAKWERSLWWAPFSMLIASSCFSSLTL